MVGEREQQRQQSLVWTRGCKKTETKLGLEPVHARSQGHVLSTEPFAYDHASGVITKGDASSVIKQEREIQERVSPYKIERER